MTYIRAIVFSLFLSIYLLFTGVLFASQDTARPSADWIKNAIVYEVFVRDFSAQGDFQGVINSIPNLKQLGVTVLWLMPVHPIGVVNRKGVWGSPYAVRDYYAITPDYGVQTDLINLVQTAHQNGMKVIMDLVADHTAWDYSWITTHSDYYHKDTSGNIISPNPSWTDVAWLNYSNITMRSEMTTMITYWVSSCDIDGYRCDYVDGVPLDFWDSVRSQLILVKPNILLLAEGYNTSYTVNAFDMDYSPPTYQMLMNVYAGINNAKDLVSTITSEQAQYPQNSIFLRYIDNHDLPPAPTVFGDTQWKAAASFMFLIDGVPLLFNGQEIGDTTRTDGGSLFSKQTIQWGDATTSRAQDYYNFYTTLIYYRQNYSALNSETIQLVVNSQDSSVVSFLRQDQNQILLAVINFSNQSTQVNISLPTNISQGQVLLKNLYPMGVSEISQNYIAPVSVSAYNYSLWQLTPATGAKLFRGRD